jgi:serine/threonine protein kinase
MADRARDYKPGDRVPGTVYEVLRLIGAGGMGTVYDVEDTSIGKRYVLKTLHPQLGAREDLARRMQNEARTLARLNHTNIVEVITAGVTADELRLPFYVMERLNGQSLRLVLEKKGQLELPHAYHIAIDLLDALDHAHDKGVIHRDVKPDNIFLHRTSAGVTVTKLLDFGILSLLDSAQQETAGRFLGTLRYAAPEQLRGEKPTAKVDVYAAGLVLYEMISGRGPFDDEGDPHKVAAAHLHKPAPPLSHFVVIPRELDALVSASLAKLPAQRPRDAFSFAASLRNLKKALTGASAAESTENRATAAAVVPGDSVRAPVVHVHQPSADGPYIISPVPATPPGAAPATPVYTTLPGMPAPSIGPSLAQPSPPPPALDPTPMSPQTVDREAATNSFVPPAAQAPQQGTGVLPPFGPGAAATLPSNEPPPPPAPPPALPLPLGGFRWPPEQPAARSEEPQVRTVSAAAPPRRSTGPVIAVVMLLALLAAASVVVVFVRLHASSTHGSAAGPGGAVVLPAPVPPPAQPVVNLPAPTLAPPALDEAPTASASAQAVATAPAPKERAPVPVSTRPVMPAVKSPPTTAAPPARPGPGF